MIDGRWEVDVAEASPRVWTYEALVAEGLEPEDFEIVDGALVEVPPVSLEGSALWSRLDSLLGPHVRAHRLGWFGNCGRFRLREEPRIERRPDLAFVAEERLPPRPYPAVFPGAPDLAIEVLSPTDPAAEAAAKAREYLTHGAQEVWNVDPEAQTVTVFHPGVPARPYGCGDTLESRWLPGLSVSLGALFLGEAAGDDRA